MKLSSFIDAPQSPIDRPSNLIDEVRRLNDEKKSLVDAPRNLTAGEKSRIDDTPRGIDGEKSASAGAPNPGVAAESAIHAPFWCGQGPAARWPQAHETMPSPRQ
ncbi:MAG TPA: hypothetical protein VGD21_03100 [Lysobacter sp.]